MPIVLDHLLIPARDRRAAAERLTTILDVPWSAQAAVGPFSAVYVSDELTVDFDQVAADAAVPLQHYAFRVGEREFDALLARLKSLGVAWRSTPIGPDDFQVNTYGGGRIVYWREPDGHAWEALTKIRRRAHRLLARAGWPRVGGADEELRAPAQGLNGRGGCGLSRPPCSLSHRL